MSWLGWGIVISGLSAVYFWKKANPGKSLNPMPPSPVAMNGFGKDADD
jgi:hypothetical protein